MSVYSKTKDFSQNPRFGATVHGLFHKQRIHTPSLKKLILFPIDYENVQVWVAHKKVEVNLKLNGRLLDSPEMLLYDRDP